MTLRPFLGALVALLFAAASPATAQTLQTGFADFGTDQGAPIEIEADELEVKDKESVAVFSGNVTVRQEGAALQTAELTVHYAQSALGADAVDAVAQGEAPATPQNQRISRLEAKGRVLITSGGQAATGDTGLVDFDDRRLQLVGNVTLTQDGNVVSGDRLNVDLDTGIARVESTSRVRVLLNPGGGD